MINAGEGSSLVFERMREALELGLVIWRGSEVWLDAFGNISKRVSCYGDTRFETFRANFVGWRFVSIGTP